MPVYPAIKTYRGGFYNNDNSSGSDDRVYNAEQLRKPYNAIYSNGIRPASDGMPGSELEVTAGGNGIINISAGFAVLGGAWFENAGVYTIELDSPTANTRYDCVILRNDDTQSVREPNIYIKSLSAIPTVSDLTRRGGIYEVCIAYVTITSGSTEITNAMITDTRAEGNLCNVMSGVGATVIRTYRNIYFSERVGQTAIPIGIQQFDRTRDTLVVIVEGRTFSENTQYTIVNNQYINVALGIPIIGTKIEFEVLKNVNAAGAETVVQEVAYLTGQTTKFNKILEYDYYCNGMTDNVQISNIVANFIASKGVTGNAQLCLKIHGKLGVTNKYSGDNWFVIGATTVESNNRVIVDFADCDKVNINMVGGTSNNIFFGVNYTVKNLNLVAQCFSANCNCTVHASVVGNIAADNCRVNIVTTGECCYAKEGTHINCNVTLSSANNWCVSFYPTTSSKAITVLGGRYVAYVGSFAQVNAIFHIATGNTNAVITAHGVSCPTVAKANFYQKNSLLLEAGYMYSFGLISALEISVQGTAVGEGYGTIPISKP